MPTETIVAAWAQFCRIWREWRERQTDTDIVEEIETKWLR